MDHIKNEQLNRDYCPDDVASKDSDALIEELSGVLWLTCRAFLRCGPHRHRQLGRLLRTIDRDFELWPTVWEAP